jgi:outer membrane protein OmpA-like peptidoglycan-associated protein
MSLRLSTLSLTVLAGLTASAAVASAAQVEDTFPFAGVALPELMLGVGTRVPAMGGAGAALSDDLSSLHWNPAGLNRFRNLELEFSHLSWIEGVSQEFIGFGMPVLAGTAGVGLSYMGLGEIERTGIDAQGQMIRTGGTLGLSLFGATLGYGSPAPWGGSLGLAAKLRLENLGERSLLGLAVDGGVQWPLGDTGATLGAVIMNLGLPVNGFPLPLGVRAGAGYLLTPAADHRVSLAADAEVPLPAASQALLHAGAEYAYADLLFVRLGYTLSDLARATTGAGLTAGLGAQFSGWTLGYAFAPQGEFGTAHRLSLALDLAALAQAARAESRSRTRSGRESSARPPSSLPTLPTKDRSEPLAFHAGASPALSVEEQAMRQLMQRSLTVKSEVQRGLVGAGAVEGIRFLVTRSSGPRIKGWTLVLNDPAGKEVVTLRGAGMPEAIPWALRNQANKVTANLRGLKYRLTLTDVNDAVETAEGPVLAEPAAARSPDRAEEPAVDRTFQDITFDLGRAEIVPAASKAIAQVAEFTRKYPRAKILIEGFCDPIDESDDALILSKARAEAVSRYLTAYHKISMTRILIRARGAKEPLVTTGEPAQRYRNRRVEITVKNTP